MAGTGNNSQDSRFAWEDEPWLAFSNSDNSAGSDENLSQKMNATDSSNWPTPTEVAAAAEAEEDVVVLPEAAAKATGMPPPPAAGKRKKREGKQQGNDQAAGGSRGKGGETDQEMHIWTERERRKKMRCMLSSLQELLPQLPQKADKSTIVDEAVNYIKILQQKLQQLQKQKLEMFQGLTTITNYPHDPHRPAATNAASSSREAFMANEVSSMNQNQEMRISPFGMAPITTAFKTWTSPNMVLSVYGDKAQINICCPKKLGVFSAICYFLEKHKIQVVTAHVFSDQYRNMYMIQAQASPGVHQFSEGALLIEEIFQLATGEIMMHMSTL